MLARLMSAKGIQTLPSDEDPVVWEATDMPESGNYPMVYRAMVDFKEYDLCLLYTANMLSDGLMSDSITEFSRPEMKAIVEAFSRRF